MLTVYQVFVHMANDEWSSHEGGGIMDRLAREQLIENLDKFSDDSVVVVTVYEHGGWWLSYTMDGCGMHCIGSANDMAKYSPGVERLWERLRTGEPRLLADIRRTTEHPVYGRLV